jgi:hypothetical protein
MVFEGISNAAIFDLLEAKNEMNVDIDCFFTKKNEKSNKEREIGKL